MHDIDQWANGLSDVGVEYPVRTRSIPGLAIKGRLACLRLAQWLTFWSGLRVCCVITEADLRVIIDFDGSNFSIVKKVVRRSGTLFLIMPGSGRGRREI